MKVKTVVGLVVGTIAAGVCYVCGVFAKGAYTETKEALKAKKEEKEKPAEETPTEEDEKEDTENNSEE